MKLVTKCKQIIRHISLLELFVSLYLGALVAFILKDSFTPLILQGKTFAGRTPVFQAGLFTLYTCMFALLIYGVFACSRFAISHTHPKNKIANQIPSFILLYSIFLLAFFFPPAWNKPENLVIKSFLLGITLLGGAFWAYIAAGEWEGQSSKYGKLSRLAGHFTILLVAITALNIPALFSSIAWRGDEDYHFNHEILLINHTDASWLVLPIILFCVCFLVSLKKPEIGFRLWIISVFTTVGFFLYDMPNSWMVTGYILRYPFLNYWLIAFIPAIVSIFHNPYLEPIFRILPLIATVGIIWVNISELLKQSPIAGWLWAVAIATVPLVWYYSSILYLELPAIFLLCLVVRRLDVLILGDFETVKREFAWIALVLIGFIKETAIIWIAAFLTLRVLASLSKNRVWFLQRLLNSRDPSDGGGKKKKQVVLGEIKIAFSLLFPVVLYLVMRLTFIQNSRNYNPSLFNLINPQNLSTLLRAYPAQFGFFFLFFIASLITMVRRREYFWVISLISIFMMVTVFFLLDDFRFLGYSRFNLYLLPLVLVASSRWINLTLEEHRKIGYLLVLLALATNLLLSPFLQDGSRKPIRGLIDFGMSEYSYPFDKVFQFLKDTPSDSSILITGHPYPVLYQFYLLKYSWSPEVREEYSSKMNDWETLPQVLKLAGQRGYGKVIYFVQGTTLPDLDSRIEGFNSQPFCNLANCLVVFYKY